MVLGFDFIDSLVYLIERVCGFRMNCFKGGLARTEVRAVKSSVAYVSSKRNLSKYTNTVSSGWLSFAVRRHFDSPPDISAFC